LILKINSPGNRYTRFLILLLTPWTKMSSSDRAVGLFDQRGWIGVRTNPPN
jgi:hypothetical protein